MQALQSIIYKVDARIWLGEESRRERRRVLLDSLDERSLDRIAEQGFGWLWLTGLWQTSDALRELLRRRSAALEELQDVLPDLCLEDIDGSPAAVTSYRVRHDLGGDDALETLRADLARRDVKLLLDFYFPADGVPPDHPWVREHPELLLSPEGAQGASTSRGIDLERDDARQAVLAEIEDVALRGDGVALHGAPELHRGLGGSDRAISFWLDASSRLQMACPPGFLLLDFDDALAEALAGRDGVVYRDRILRGLLAQGKGAAARDHLVGRSSGDRVFLDALEWDDTPRAAAAFPLEQQMAATLVVCFSPGGVAFSDAQVEGTRKRWDVRLARRAPGEPDRELLAFHQALLEILERPEVSRGRSLLPPIREAWPGNSSWKQFLVFLERDASGQAMLAVVNYGPERAQCYVDLACLEPQGIEWVFQDLLSLAVYPRNGDELRSKGLYLDLAPWDYNVFEIQRARSL